MIEDYYHKYLTTPMTSLSCLNPFKQQGMIIVTCHQLRTLHTPTTPVFSFDDSLVVGVPSTISIFRTTSQGHTRLLNSYSY